MGAGAFVLQVVPNIQRFVSIYNFPYVEMTFYILSTGFTLCLQLKLVFNSPKSVVHVLTLAHNAMNGRNANTNRKGEVAHDDDNNDDPQAPMQPPQDRTGDTHHT